MIQISSVYKFLSMYYKWKYIKYLIYIKVKLKEKSEFAWSYPLNLNVN